MRWFGRTIGGRLRLEAYWTTYSGVATLILSNEILAEVTRVLRYPRFQALYGLSEEALLGYSRASCIWWCCSQLIGRRCAAMSELRSDGKLKQAEACPTTERDAVS